MLDMLYYTVYWIIDVASFFILEPRDPNPEMTMYFGPNFEPLLTSKICVKYIVDLLTGVNSHLATYKIAVKEGENKEGRKERKGG